MKSIIPILGATAGALAGYLVLKELYRLEPCPVCEMARRLKLELPLALGSGAVAGFGLGRLVEGRIYEQ